MWTGLYADSQKTSYVRQKKPYTLISKKIKHTVSSLNTGVNPLVVCHVLCLTKQVNKHTPVLFPFSLCQISFGSFPVHEAELLPLKHPASI